MLNPYVLGRILGLPKPEPIIDTLFSCDHCERNAEVKLQLKLVRMIKSGKAHMACQRCARFMWLLDKEMIG